MRRAALLLCLVALASPAHAAGGSGGDSALYWQIANFVLLVVTLFVLLRKPVQAFFQDRRSEVASNLDDAAQLLDEAETRFTEWQRKLIDLDSDLETIRRESAERAQRESDQIVADARASAERIRRDATAAVEQELLRAREELREEASDLAVELAQRMLQEQVMDTDRDRLADEFISQLERGANGTER